MDKNGNPYISHYQRTSDASNFNLKILYWYSGNRHTTTVNYNVGKASVNDFTSLAFNKEGKLSVAYGHADPSAWVASSDFFVARQISAPVVTSISPSSGSTGTTVTPLHIYGDGFEFGATLTLAPTSSSPVVVSYPKVLRVSPQN